MSVKPTIDAGLQRLIKLLCVFLCLWFPLIGFLSNHNMAALERDSPIHLPFGVFRDSGGNVYLQDFSYNVLYLKGIKERMVPHPYRLADQETLIRRMVPGITAGMTHAYSPVGLVLALPFISVPGAEAYLIYTSFAAIASVLLFCFYLLPRVESRLQLYALSAGALGVCLFVAFQLGQSSLITTPILGAFWMLLQKRTSLTTLSADTLLALLFWILCLKPSLALIPLFLLLGAGAWRVLAIGILLLLATWIFTSGYYGGFWTGLQDYMVLLNHYDNEEFTPFMQRGNDFAFAASLTSFDPHLSVHLFSLDRSLVLFSNLALLSLRWTSRITASEHFQGAIWIFLLFSPYLSGSEYWILCLLITEGRFFKSSTFPYAFGKFLLISGIVSFGTITLLFVCKWLLFSWIVMESISKRILNTDDQGETGRAIISK
jgi:hypothetical protein